MPRPSLPDRGDLAVDALIRSDFRPFRGQTVLVVGDLILDHYLWGRVERVTPEAPVPVVQYDRETHALGGAANVAHNVVALGARAILVGVLGKDEAGERFRTLMKEAGIATGRLVSDASRPTTEKTRIVSMGQQLLRIDREDGGAVSAALAKRVIAAAERAMDKAGAVVLSDYAKGVVTDRVIDAVTRAAHRRGIPVFVDPKGRDYARYRDVDVIKPNQREAAEATGFPVGSEQEIVRAGRGIIAASGAQAVVVSRGAEGFTIVRAKGRARSMAARAREVFDVTGAGDSFMAVLAVATASGAGLLDAADLANEAGGIVVGRLGMAVVTPADLKAAITGAGAAAKVRTAEDLVTVLASERTRGRRVVFTNGCFDLLHPGHIRFLEEARRLGDILVVGLNTDRSVRAVKGKGRPILGEDERASILAALEAVDYLVFFDEETPERLLKTLRPEVLAKGRNVAADDVVGREIVEGYGGEIRRLPVFGSSTTSELIDAIVGKFDRPERGAR